MHDQEESAISKTQLQKFVDRKSLVSHIIVINMICDKSRCVPKIEKISAVGCAIQNNYLGQETHGVARCFSTEMVQNEQFWSYRNLGEDDKRMGYIILGVANSDYRCHLEAEYLPYI